MTLAVTRGLTHVVEYVLQQGCDPNRAQWFDGKTPLHIPAGLIEPIRSIAMGLLQYACLPDLTHLVYTYPLLCFVVCSGMVRSVLFLHHN